LSKVIRKKQRPQKMTTAKLKTGRNPSRKIKSGKIKSEASFCGYEWVQLTPKGVVFEGHHFVFILEDKEKQTQMPVRFPLQSADLISLPNMVSIWKKSLTTLNEKLFPKLDVRLQRCVFIPKKGERSRVKVFYIRNKMEEFIESDLDKVLGLCLDAKLPFYATRSYIQQSKVSAQDNEIFLQNQRWTEGQQKYLM
jgi:hypothetical protein